MYKGTLHGWLDAIYLNDEKRPDVRIRISGNGAKECAVDIMVASNRIDTMRKALVTISEQGGDIVEKWSAEVARRALITSNSLFEGS